MGFFDDDVYENLDWLSQAVTPMLFSGNTILSQLPDTIDVSQLQMLDAINKYGRIEKSSILNSLVDRENTKTWIYEAIRRCFKFECENNVMFDPGKGIFPSIKLVKAKQSFSEKEIIKLLEDRVYYMCLDRNLERLNEILELIDYKPINNLPSARSSRSAKKKVAGITKTLNNIFAENQWQIRDADLMARLVSWIQEYVCYGNLAALTNITKLKIMTHKKQPIYSIKETI